jgi:hypothetical protein
MTIDTTAAIFPKMKNKAKESDVDFTGGQNNPLTKEEEKAISDFIVADKKTQT